MSQLLTLSRAARLVGVSRGALQKKVKDGELPTFEGMVAPNDLLRVYPQTHLEDNTLFERLMQIRDSAFARRIRERMLPDPEVLALRLSDLGRELAETRAQLVRFRTVSAECDRRLSALTAQLPGEARTEIGALRDWLQAALTRAPDETENHQLAAKESTMRVMVAHVQVIPSQREFFVEGSDTLLDAALRAGLALNYGCSNGNCGLCKARIVTGQVKKVRSHDYVLSEADKNAGTVLMCSNTAVNDLVIEAVEAGSAREIPLQQIAARIKATERLSDDIVLLHLQTPRTRRLRFLAGQYVTLQAGDSAPIDYPVASCPCDDRNLQFHVQRMPGNPFTDRVFNGLKSGDTVNILGPRGEFVLREDSPHKLVFIAQDTGFAPIKSLIEHAMALDVAESLHLYWLATEGRGHYLSNLCRSWSDALDNFHFTPLELPESAASDSEHLKAELMHIVHDHVPLSDCDVYVAGSPALLTAVQELLPAKGLPVEQLVLGYPR
ncbi:MAG TPA: 2Fe-2S iron-sulfur cluster-binding protein [Acidiferrobacterales bacterium]|nr:2Fe-2S iron-sulfur cluster-binding protein [Acidiferrobacterales bacterium]